MISFVHIPRTGGLGLGETLRGVVRSPGHMPRLSDTDEAITIVRDPVARFVSAYDHQQQDLTIDEMAQDPAQGGWWFDRQTRWIDCDRPLLWVGHTETLDADFTRLCALLGLSDRTLTPGYNASRQHSTLTPAAEASVRAWYAEDYALLERLA